MTTMTTTTVTTVVYCSRISLVSRPKGRMKPDVERGIQRYLLLIHVSAFVLWSRLDTNTIIWSKT